MTTVTVNTYTHSVAYVSDNILKSLKDVILFSGLNPTKFVNCWSTYALATRTWLGTGDLERVVLEIYHPTTDALLFRWDIDISYGWSADDGSFWTDTDQLRYAIKKAGLAPSEASYDIVLKTKLGRPDVPGWGAAGFRSTENMVRQSLGATIEHYGLGGNTAYWRKL